MKNVLLITQGFPYGASEQGFLPTEYQKLRESFRLSVLAFGKGGEPQFPLPDDVHHRRYSWAPRRSLMGMLRQLRHQEVRADIALFCKSRKLGLFKGIGNILLYSYRAEQVTPLLRQIVQEDQIDIIYSYWCVQTTLAAVRLKKEFPSLKVVCRFHGMDLYEERLALGWQCMRPYIARSCERLIFICEDGMRYFLAHWGQEWAAKSTVIHVGCRALPRCDNVSRASQPLVLVSCASVIPIKRVSLIVDGLAALPDTAEVSWHHFGDGDLMEALKSHASALLANRPNIHYTLHGAIPNAALPQAYLDAGAQLFVLLSETEGIPVSMMEAFAMGIPVAATAVGGIPEMVHSGENGYLLSPTPKPEEIAAVLMRYIAMPETERAAMAQKALECWQREYSAADNADRVVCLLNECLKGEKTE